MVACKKVLLGKWDFRYFIGCKYDKKIRLLCIFFPNASAYIIDFAEIECMCFMIKEEKVFDKYIKIWGKADNIIKKINTSANDTDWFTSQKRWKQLT